MDLGVKDKVAIITGGTFGIGRAAFGLLGFQTSVLLSTCQLFVLHGLQPCVGAEGCEYDYGHDRTPDRAPISLQALLGQVQDRVAPCFDRLTSEIAPYVFCQVSR